MKTEYRRDLQHSYLVIHTEETEEQDYTVRMMAENRLEGLLTLDVRKIDRQILFYYDITSRISVAEYCQFRKITGLEIRRLLLRLVNILTSMEEYLLGGEYLCLQADYIFTDAEFAEIEFCFIPGRKDNLSKQFQSLMEYFLPVLNHDNKDEMLTVYQIYGYAVQEHFSLEWLRKILQTGDEEEREKKEIKEEISVCDFSKEQDENISTEQQWVNKREHEKALEAFFEDEQDERKNVSPWITLGAVLVICCLLVIWYIWRNWPQYRWGGIGLSGCIISVFLIISYCRTTNRFKDGNVLKNILPKKDMEKDDLLKNSGEKYELPKSSKEEYDLQEDKLVSWKKMDEWNRAAEEKEEYTRILQPQRLRDMAVFKECFPDTDYMLPIGEKKIQLIGHQEGKVDLFLKSDMSSRIHAKLRKSEGHFYLSDLNSRNGTWVNGKALEGKTEIELCSGDEVKFADQIFNFLC